MIGNYKKLQERSDLSPLEEQIVDAVKEALYQAGQLKHGKDIMEAAVTVLISRQYSATDYAKRSYQSITTVGRRLSVFVNLVADELGLSPNDSFGQDPEEVQP